MCVCMHACVYARVRAIVCVYAQVCVCTSVSMCVCVCAGNHVFVSVSDSSATKSYSTFNRLLLHCVTTIPCVFLYTYVRTRLCICSNAMIWLSRAIY